MGPLRRTGNWALRGLVRAAFGGRYSDLCYGYNAFWRRVLPVIEGDADGFEIETLMNVRVLAAGLQVAEIPSYEAARIHGLPATCGPSATAARVLRLIVRERPRSLRGRRRLTVTDVVRGASARSPRSAPRDLARAVALRARRSGRTRSWS